MTKIIDREFLGTVKTKHGIYEVYIPTLGETLLLDWKSDDYPIKLAALAVGVPFEEFIHWSMIDGNKVGALLADAIELL